MYFYHWLRFECFFFLKFFGFGFFSDADSDYWCLCMFSLTQGMGKGMDFTPLLLEEQWAFQPFSKQYTRTKMGPSAYGSSLQYHSHSHTVWYTILILFHECSKSMNNQFWWGTGWAKQWSVFEFLNIFQPRAILPGQNFVLAFLLPNQLWSDSIF